MAAGMYQGEREGERERVKTKHVNCVGCVGVLLSSLYGICSAQHDNIMTTLQRRCRPRFNPCDVSKSQQ